MKKTDSGRYLLNKVIENLSSSEEIGHKWLIHSDLKI